MSESTLRVATLGQSDTSRWNAFVIESPEATFFHHAGWRRVIEKAFGHRCHFLYAERDGRIEGVLPLVHVKSRLFNNALVSTPFCVYGGVAADTQGAREVLETAARERARLLNVDYLELREREPRHPDWPVKDLYYTFRKQIHPGEEENLKAIPRKQRAIVRKSLKNDLEIEFDTDVDRLYGLYAHSLRDLGTPVFSKKYMALLRQTFGRACEIMIVTHQGQPVAGVLNFYFRDAVLPYYAGANESTRGLRAHDFMYWQLMCHAAQHGVQVFDFGRSKRATGSFDFKRHWGFEPQLLYYAYDLVRAHTMPDLNPNNPRYERMIRAWRKMPVPLTRIVGPPLARSLG